MSLYIRSRRELHLITFVVIVLDRVTRIKIAFCTSTKIRLQTPSPVACSSSCVSCHSLFFIVWWIILHVFSFQACLGEAVTLSEVKKVIIEWTDAYEGKYTTFSLTWQVAVQRKVLTREKTSTATGLFSFGRDWVSCNKKLKCRLVPILFMLFFRSKIWALSLFHICSSIGRRCRSLQWLLVAAYWNTEPGAAMEGHEVSR